MKKIKRVYKLNNSGMSFVELLTAVLILAIVSVPFLHSYLSSARVNAKSRITLNGTALCENVMEEFEAYDFTYLQGLVDSEGNPVFSVDVSGNEMTYISSGKHYDDSLGDYTVSIHLDPNAKAEYESYNNLNLTDVQEFKANACAVYSMLPEADENAYKQLEAISTIEGHNVAYYRTHAARIINIKFSSLGNISTIVDGAETLIKHVKVDVSIKYAAEDGVEYSIEKNVYDNRNSAEPFIAMYLMYTPIYSYKKDVIFINNDANIDGTCYVMREVTVGDNVDGHLTNYKPQIVLRENPAWAPGVSNIEGYFSSMRVRTNLFEDGSPMSTKFFPIYIVANKAFYSNAGVDFTTWSSYFPSAKGITTENVLISSMKMQTADGRNFDGTSNKDRIYSVNISVSKDTDSNIIANLTGTITK